MDSNLGFRHKLSWYILFILIIIGIVYIYMTANVIRSLPHHHKYTGKPVCHREMFNGDINAFWACRGLDALQNNWFPSPIAGLFSYQAWNGFDGFWQNGVVLETLANYMSYTKSSRYRQTLLSAYRSLGDLTNAYYPVPSCDDELWYGLAYMRIYEVTGEVKFLTMSQSVFNWVWDTCWDDSMSCQGGLFFDSSHGYKGTITNVQALMLAPWIYSHTKDGQYIDKAYQLLNFITTNRIIDPETFLVCDSIDLTTCQATGPLLTYECGMAVGAMVKFYKVSGLQNYTKMAHNIASTTISHLTVDGVLTEVCDPKNCKDSKDARSFKGIFVRNIRYLMDVSPSDKRQGYQQFLQRNIESLLHNATCYTTFNKTTNHSNHCTMEFQDGAPLNTPTGPVFNENWQGPFQYSTPIEHTSALSLLVAAILPNTHCNGTECDYDPDVPNTDSLTCETKPCPQGHTCCSWDQRYHTCCTPGQRCIQGGCY